MARGPSGLPAAALVLALVVCSLGSAGAAASPPADARLFAETGFRISDDSFWDFFSHRGGLATFGYPISREFQLRGQTVQLFQRLALVRHPDGSVGVLNLLGPDLFTFTQVNFASFPAVDPDLLAAAPQPGGSDYPSRLLDFVRANVPDDFDGFPVRFLSSYLGSVTPEMAFPDGNGNPDLLPQMDTELWGAPTSQPSHDPNNPAVAYQRFERAMFRYSQDCRCTQVLPLADYLKALLTGDGLPPDLQAEAQGSPLLRQYDPAQPRPVRPDQLPDTDLSQAFQRDLADQGDTAAILATPTREPSSRPFASPQATPAAPLPSPQAVTAAASIPYVASSPEYGVGVFAWKKSNAGDLFNRVYELSFTWQKSLFSWRDIEGAGKGKLDWSGSDALLRAARAGGLRNLIRVDFPPRWARSDGANNGPPDNYQDYADFLTAMVGRYRTGSEHGHIDAIEVWNEPNLSREWGNAPIDRRSAAEYVKLLSVAYAAIKAVDPSVIVLSAGLSPTGWNDQTARPDDQYLQWLYDAGLKGHYDVLGAHAPGYKAPPETSPAEAAANADYGGDRSFTFRRVEDLRAIMERNGEGNRQIWITEFGWTSDTVHPDYAWFHISEDQKADYLVRAFHWAHDHWAPWIGAMLVWNIPDPAWGPQDEQYWWGITNPDGSPRPAYLALRSARRSGILP